jgi:signal transduction histidine kinase
VIADVRRPVVIGAVSLFGLIVIGLLLSGLFGPSRALQLIASLVVPAAVMVGFWFQARERVLARETEFDRELELETLTNRATSEFVAAVSHELVPHPERCSLRAEALAVAVDYRNIRPDLKVAVPDLVVFTDPHLLRQVLHVLVGNAVRYGGERIAIWAAADERWVRLSVSDDGPGLPPGIGDHVFGRYVDLAGNGGAGRRGGGGLSVARTISELIGGQITYKRDPNWTHFSVSLPATVDEGRLRWQRLPLEAGVR